MILIHISRLIRLPNLLMVTLTLFLMRLSVIEPILKAYELELQVSGTGFWLLVLSCVLITAAGYVINDYHDVRADRINHSQTVVIDTHISRRIAMIMHLAMNTLGALLGVFASIYYRIPWLIPVFVFVPFLLWGYSAFLKHMAVLGNLAVAVLSGLVPLMVVLFEYPLLNRYYPEFITLHPGGFRNILFWVGAFSFFAFMTTWIREIIKDLEDMKGDREIGSQTLPLLKGLAYTRVVTIAMSGITLGVLVFFFVRYLHDWISLVYGGVFLFLPFLILVWLILRAKEQKQFHFLSQWMKGIMLCGLAYAPIAHFLIKLYF